MKKYLILVLIVLLMGALFIGVPAAKEGNVPQKPAGNSNIAHMYLYEKENFVEGGWDIVNGGAWGKMKYNLSGATFDFVFNGHGLEPGINYTLIYYPDPWPGSGLICLGSGTVNEEGDIHIAESAVDTGDLTDAKIWLVLTDDIDCGVSFKNVWNPTEYLFEYDLITFDDTGV